jgi:hypothetical protein
MWKSVFVSLTSSARQVSTRRLIPITIQGQSLSGVASIKDEPTDPAAAADSIQPSRFKPMRNKSDAFDTFLEWDTLTEKNFHEDLSFGFTYYFFNLARRMQEGKVTSDQLLQDSYFQEQYNTLREVLSNETKLHSINVSSKLILLKAFQIIGMANQDPLVQSLNRDILCHVQSMPILTALNFLVYQVDHQETELQRQVIARLRDHVQANLSQICKISHFIDFYKLSGTSLFDNETLLRMDEVAQTQLLKEIQSERPKNVAHLITVISTSGRRPKALVKLLAFALRNSDLRSLSSQHLCNLIMALSALHLPDLNILAAICEHLVSKKFTTEISSKNIEWVLKSLVRLHFKPVDLLMHLDGILRQTPYPLGVLTTIDYTIACAKLNHRLSDVHELLFDIDELHSEVDKLPPIKKLEFCWAKVFHGVLDANSANQLFDQAFLNLLFKDKEDASFLKVKLLQIAYDQTAKGNTIKIPNCVLDFNRIGKTSPFQSLIAEDLQNVVSANQTLNDVKTDFGANFGKFYFSFRL